MAAHTARNIQTVTMVPKNKSDCFWIQMKHIHVQIYKGIKNQDMIWALHMWTLQKIQK